MSLKNRAGNFFILGGLIFLLIFVASALPPNTSYDLTALIVGLLAFFLGWRWRLSKPSGGGRPAGPPPAAPPAPKKQSPLTTLLHGPAAKKPAPAAAKPAGSPSAPPKKGLGRRPGKK